MADKFTIPKFEDYFFKLANDSNDIKKILSESDGDIGSNSFGGGDYNNYASVFGVVDESVTSDDLFDDVKEISNQLKVAKEVKKTVKVAQKLPIKQPIKKAAKLTTSDLFDSTPSEYINNVLGNSDDPLALYLKNEAIQQEASQQGGMIKEASNTLGFDTLEVVGGAGDVVVDELGYEWSTPNFDESSQITHTASRHKATGGGGGGGRASQADLIKAGFKPFEHIGGGYSVGVNRGDTGPLTAKDVRDKMMQGDDGDPDNIYIDKSDLHQGDDMFGGSSVGVVGYGSSNNSRLSFTTNAISNQGGIVTGGGGVSYGMPANSKPQNTSEISKIAKTKVSVNRFKVI